MLSLAQRRSSCWQSPGTAGACTRWAASPTGTSGASGTAASETMSGTPRDGMMLDAIRPCKDAAASSLQQVAMPNHLTPWHVLSSQGRCPGHNFQQAHLRAFAACRRFIKGDPGSKAAFATRLAGSADLYNVNNRCAQDTSNVLCTVLPGLEDAHCCMLMCAACSAATGRMHAAGNSHTCQLSPTG